MSVFESQGLVFLFGNVEKARAAKERIAAEYERPDPDPISNAECSALMMANYGADENGCKLEVCPECGGRIGYDPLCETCCEYKEEAAE